MKCSIQGGKAKLNRTSHLSLNENACICTIVQMKNINYLFYIYNVNICHLQDLINLYRLKNTNSVLIALCQCL